MILWTIQSPQAWAELKKNGILRARHRHIIEPTWRSAYGWMAKQMVSRIGPSPEPGCSPIWVWHQWEGAKKMPDLRCAGHLGRGEHGVRLKLEYPDNGVLLSDFSLWHYVLNYWFLPESEADAERFESRLAAHGLSFFSQKPLPNDEFHRSIVESWNRIFDLEWFQPEVCEPMGQKSIQATIWEIRLEQVKDCKHFTSR